MGVFHRSETRRTRSDQGGRKRQFDCDMQRSVPGGERRKESGGQRSRTIPRDGCRGTVRETKKSEIRSTREGRLGPRGSLESTPARLDGVFKIARDRYAKAGSRCAQKVRGNASGLSEVRDLLAGSSTADQGGRVGGGEKEMQNWKQ